MRNLTIDLQNYRVDGSFVQRVAARGIICRGGKYLVITGKYGDCKFPGGGQEEGETLSENLRREVREETGYCVKEETAQEVICVTERRKGDPDDLMIMQSHYFLCDVEDEAGERDLDDYEREYGYQVKWLPLEECIRINEAVTDDTDIPWVARELMVMRELTGLTSRKEEAQ